MPLSSWKSEEREFDKQIDGFYDRRDSVGTIYASLIPFIGLEYLVEVSIDASPSGLVFPLGFILFWGFFYTFYKPSFLEDGFPSSRGFNFHLLLPWFFGFIAWFLRATLDEIYLLAFGKHLFKEEEKSQSMSQPRLIEVTHTSSSTPPPLPRRYPKDIEECLGVLELQGEVDWNQIHRKYRELAKRYHPDLHPEETELGKRFIRVDQAYRKLNRFRSLYFH